MRLFGHKVFRGQHVARLAVLVLPFFGLLLLAVSASPAFGQSAPYVVPYTITSIAGAHAPYTATATPCGNFQALDGSGDGCLATQMSVGSDPHDVRVDPAGNIYFIDLTSGTLVHKINPFTGVVTVFYGSTVSTKACSAQGTTDKTGDNCTSTDGAANSTASTSGYGYSYNSQPVRGMSAALNGDILLAGYNDDEIHRILAPSLFIELLGGSYHTTGTANGAVGSSLFSGPRGVGSDASNNVYVADTGNNILRLINTSLVTSNFTATNTSKTLNTTPGPYGTALVAAPEDVQVDANGNIIIADYANNDVRGIYMGKGPFFGISNPQTGWIYVLAGTGVAPSGTYTSYPNYPSTPTTVLATNILMSVRKFGTTPQGDLIVADASDNVIWFIDHTTGYARAIAGQYGTAATTTPAATCSAATDAIGDGCPGFDATIDNNSDLASSPDALGNVYITDAEGGSSSASRIRKINSGLNFPTATAGTTTTQTVNIHFIAGDTPGAAGFTIASPSGDFKLASKTCTVEADNTDDCFLTITYTPTVAGFETATLTAASTKNGNSNFILSGTGSLPQVAFDPGTTSVFTSSVSNPQSVVLDGAGNAYIADTGNNRILFYNAATATTTTIAGGTNCGTATDSFGDGCLATQATLKSPKAVTVDAAGNIFIADTGNNLIRKINTGTGIISLYAGGASSVCSNAVDTFGDYCPATSATLSSPSGLTADPVGNLYVSDTGHNVIRTISTSGYIELFAGGATSTCTAKTDVYGDGCAATQTTFSAPTALAFDHTGLNILVADTGDNVVRKIYLGTSISAPAASGAFSIPTSILVNPVSLIAGNGGNGSSIGSNGVATNSQLSAPTGVAVDAAGNAYIADTGNNSVRLVNTATGIISTIVGITSSTGGTGTVPGSATAAQLTAPAAVAVAPNGTLYTADSGNNRILSDVRGQVTYNFGRVNETTSSPFAFFTELNISPLSVTTPTPLFTQSTPVNTQFTLAGVANSNNSIAACAAGATLTSGSICYLEGQFTPTTTGSESSTFSQTITGAVGTPSITLTGTGAVLTPTTSTVMQSANSQYGAPVTFTVAITPQTCNAAAPAPSCVPTGTATIIVDNVAQAPVAVTANAGNTGATASVSVTGLSVGSHTVSCNYSGDFYYAASSCTAITAVVASASTTSLLSLTNNNATQYAGLGCTTVTGNSSETQCIATTLTATVVSNTSGIPTGSVGFFAFKSGTNVDGAVANITAYSYTTATSNNISTYTFTITAANALTVGESVFLQGLTGATFLNGTGFEVIGATSTQFVIQTNNATITIPSGFPTSGKETGTATPAFGYTTLNSATGIGSYKDTYTYGTNGSISTDTSYGFPLDNTLPPGTYTITCIYGGSTNFASSSCGAVTYTVAPMPASLSLTAIGCPYTSLYASGTTTPSQSSPCTGAAPNVNGNVQVAVAEGSTTDVTLFVTPSNTVSGTLTFTCSGLPQYSVCTFSPTTLTVTPSTAFPTPMYTDVTFWNDVTGTSVDLKKPAFTPATQTRQVSFAAIIGWPLTILGFAGILVFRRKRTALRGLSLAAAFLVLAGSAITLSGCNGPGAYHAVLTPAGTYPVVITVTGGGVTKSVTVEYTVTAPGITGFE